MFPNSRVFGLESFPLPLSSKGGLRFPSWPAPLLASFSCPSPRPPHSPRVSRRFLLSPKNQNEPDQRPIPSAKNFAAGTGHRPCFFPGLPNLECQILVIVFLIFRFLFNVSKSRPLFKQKNIWESGNHFSMPFISTGFFS